MRNKPRLAIFGNSSLDVSLEFFNAFARQQKQRWCKIVAVFDCGQNDLLHIIRAYGLTYKYYSLNDCFGVYVRHLNQSMLNNPKFIANIKRLNLDGAICCGAPFIFSAELLEALKYTVNYHNSALPAYGGCGSTRLAAWHGEKQTGWTLHVMTNDIDGGNILAQQIVPLNYERNKNIVAIDRLMAKAAGIELSDMITDGKFGADGTPQSSENRSYYGYKYWLNTITVDDIGNLSIEEWRRRLTIFGYVRVKFMGRYVYYTSPGYIYYLPDWLFKAGGLSWILGTTR